MLLNLSDDHLKHLEFLRTASDEIVQEFAGISMKFLSSGINHKIFRVAAQKLEVDQDIVENTVIGLMQVYSEAMKHKLSIEDLFDSLIALEFQESAAEILKVVFASDKETKQVLTNCAPTLPAYDNLEWRFDIKLASRSLYQQITPLILMKVHTRDNGKKSVKTIQTDPVNLLHMCSVIEEALDEMKSNHTRRITRNIT